MEGEEDEDVGGEEEELVQVCPQWEGQICVAAPHFSFVCWDSYRGVVGRKSAYM